MAGGEAGGELATALLSRFRRADGERTGEGWRLSYSTFARVFFSTGAAGSLVLLIALDRTIPAWNAGGRVLGLGIAGALLLGCGWFSVLYWRLRLDLTEAGFECVRPFRPPLAFSWREISDLRCANSVLTLIARDGRKLGIELLGLNGLSRLREFLDRKLPYHVIDARLRSPLAFDRVLPPFPAART